MNLIININENLHSIKGSGEGEQKLQAAINEAMESIKDQIKINLQRQNSGLKPLPYNSIIKDEYGKDIVQIKETKSLEEIRKAYQKKQENLSYENREKNLLLAMNEIGNSNKTEYDFKDELSRQLNKNLFIDQTSLTPDMEKILDYFGDTKGLFNTINFKRDISMKCIKDLIDLPNPNTGKPPKSFEQLFTNILSINNIFKNNPYKEEYIELARNYINHNYKKLVPKEYSFFFENRNGLQELINKNIKIINENNIIKSMGFEVSEKNFKGVYQTFSQFEMFTNKPVELFKFLWNHVSEENKKNVNKWLTEQGFKDEDSMKTILKKWETEIPKTNKNSRKPSTKSDDFSGMGQ